MRKWLRGREQPRQQNFSFPLPFVISCVNLAFLAEGYMMHAVHFSGHSYQNHCSEKSIGSYWADFDSFLAIYHFFFLFFLMVSVITISEKVTCQQWMWKMWMKGLLKFLDRVRDKFKSPLQPWVSNWQFVVKWHLLVKELRICLFSDENYHNIYN